MDELHALVTAAQGGDLDAFSHIVQRFQGMAYASAYTMLEDAHLAEDAAQEAFIEAYLKLSNLREPAAFPGWFRRIVFKQGDRLTRGKHLLTVPFEPTSIFDIPLDDLDPALLVESRELRDAVRGMVDALPERERIVTLLFYGSGYTLKDIADYLEVPLSTVKKRLFDARKRLKALLLDSVRDTLQEQQRSHERNFPGRVRLLIAIRLGDAAQVRALLELEPFLVNTKVVWQVEQQQRCFPIFPIGYTALHEAAASGRTELTDLLLDFGANPHVRTRSGLTPLSMAILYNHVDVAKRLLAHGVDARGELCRATMRDYREIVQLLLADGIEVNAQGRSGRTALHWAALKGHRKLVQLLLCYGADASIQDELGRTPADWAIVKGYDEIAAILQSQMEHRAETSLQKG
ncbi:MAG TPA: sigma-70 family RNA polymerase sigma factor [Ktedonosporobacter sp.]|jgi:RNA polymerase sigma factor (sigma-70 family)|nr:sigma-70 family RNA polymerase sigma factor [Ktedonosporobacter sp.]